MVKRIVIEMDTEESPADLAADISALVMSRMDDNMEFSVRQEIDPEPERELQVFSFVNDHKAVGQRHQARTGQTARRKAVSNG